MQAIQNALQHSTFSRKTHCARFTLVSTVQLNPAGIAGNEFRLERLLQFIQRQPGAVNQKRSPGQHVLLRSDR